MKYGLLTAVAVITVLSMTAAFAGFTAYNDCNYTSAYTQHGTLDPNVTAYSIGSGFTGATSGLLKEYGTGLSTGVTATLTQNTAVSTVVFQPDPTFSGPADCAVGTDAYNAFHGIVNLVGVIYYGGSGWWVDLTFTGLNPNSTYDFTTTAERGGGSGYLSRITKFTISGADSFSNISSAGTTLGDSGASTTFISGDNVATGYVARWSNIIAGSDGSFTVRAQSAGGNSYAFDAFRLIEAEPVVPEPGSIIALGSGLLGFAGLALRRRSGK